MKYSSPKKTVIISFFCFNSIIGIILWSNDITELIKQEKSFKYSSYCKIQKTRIIKNK